MNRLTFAAAALAAFGLTGAAIGQSGGDPAIEAAVKARHGLMQNYAFNLGALGAMAKGDMEYDAELAQAAAGNLAALAGLDQRAMWPEGSDNATVEGSRALPAIWEDMAGFEKAESDLKTAADAMAEAAGTDLAALQQAMAPLGGACGACHKTYRASQ